MEKSKKGSEYDQRGEVATIALSMRRVLGFQFFAFVLFPSLLALNPSAFHVGVSARITPREKPYPIIVQDGLGFSGILDAGFYTPYTVPASAIGSPILHSSWPGGLTPLGNYRFHGGVFDGSSVWLVPYDSSQVIRISTVNKTMTVYDQWPQNGFVKSAGAFTSGIFDGSSIWLIPYNADRVVRIHIANGSMVGYKDWPIQSGFVKSGAAFGGSVYDGSSIWMVPYSADRVVRLFCSNGTMVGYKNWPLGMTVGPRAFSGGVFDGVAVWLVPQEADRFVRISLNGSMTGHFFPPPGGAFSPSSISAVLTTPTDKGGLHLTIEKSRIWQIPYDASTVQSWSPSNFSSASQVFPTWPPDFTKGSQAFAGGTFDGCSVWFAPSGTGTAIRIFTGNGSMQAYPLWPSGYTVPTIAAFRGAVFDGTSVWFVPCGSNTLIQLPSSPCPGYNSTDTATSSLTQTVLDAHTPTHTSSATHFPPRTPTTPVESFLWKIRTQSRTRTTRAPTLTRPRLLRLNSTESGTKSLPGQRRVQPLGCTRTQTKTAVLSPPPIVRRPNAVATVLGSQQAAQVVTTSSVSTALVAGSISPTMASQAGRTFALLRVANCKFNNDTEDAPEYLELPLQMVLGGVDAGLYPRYAGSLVLTLTILFLLPALLILTFHVLLHRFPQNKALHFVQRKIVATLFFLAVGYFLPTTWKVFLLVVTNDSHASSIIAVTLALIICLVTYGGLLRLSLKPPSLALFSDHEYRRLGDGSEAKTEMAEETLTKMSILHSTFGPLFSGTRNANLPVRLYFIEDLLVTSMLQALNGAHTGDPLYCRGIATSMTLVMLIHIAYLALVRPYREIGEWILTVVGSIILLAIGIVACLIVFSNDSSTQMELYMNAVGYLGLAESVYFYVQLCVVAVLEVSRAHRRRLRQHWMGMRSTESPLLVEEHNVKASLEVPLLDVGPTVSTGKSTGAMMISDKSDDLLQLPTQSIPRRSSTLQSNPLTH